jgi:hypothetical protein
MEEEKAKKSREFFMYFAPSRQPEGRVLLRGDSICFECYEVFLFPSCDEELRMQQQFPLSPERKKKMPDSKRNRLFRQFFFFVRVHNEMFGQLVLGLASGLEAFSREPPCDSIGALAVRQTPETSGMAWEFLSYYPKLPSRCLRDPPCYLVDLCVTKKKKYFFFSVRAAQPSHTTLGRPKHSPRTIALRDSCTRNSQLSRVKPTCLTTV